MQFKTINDRISTSVQIQLTEMDEVSKAGFKAIICNRPDGEGSDQPTFAELAIAAKKAGLEARYIPVVSGSVSESDAKLFAKALTLMLAMTITRGNTFGRR